MNARDIVTARIAEQAQRFPDLIISPMETGDLDARDAGLAAAIDHAVMRRWLTLAAVIESRLSRPWAELEPKMQAVLLTGAAQLLMMERLPDHAVINESVDWAKRHVRTKAGGMVNAVLRKVAGLRKEITAKPTDAMNSSNANFDRDELPLGDGRVWKLNEVVFDESPVLRLAQQTSHPESLLMHWATVHGPKNAAMIAQHDMVHAPIVMHGLAGADVATDAAGGISATRLSPHDQKGFFVFSGDRTELANLLRQHPGAIVQDSTSAAAALATRDGSPKLRLIIDSCAGKGTKTRQLAALHPAATIVATDISEERVAVLREQFAESDRVQVIEHSELSAFNGRADLVMLDVPCSNTGVLARRVEARYRFSRQSLLKLVDLQRQIIADSLLLLAEGGRLLYATCSIEAAENQQQAEWICQWHPMRTMREQALLPAGQPGEPPRTYRDGGYFAILERIAKK